MVSRTSGIGSTQKSSQASTNNSTTAQTGTSTTTQSSSQRGGSNSTQTTDIKNMTGSSLLALEQLINGLSGTYRDVRGPVGRNKSGENNLAVQRLTELSNSVKAQLTRANNLSDDYSKSAAFADSAGASSAALARALEESMPTITAGIDAAGTSGGSMSALLTQRAAEDAARQAAELGLNAAIAYGQINASAQTTAASLVGQGDAAIDALLSALGIAKGAVQTGTVKNSESNWSNATGTSTQTGTSVSNTSGSTQDNATVTQTPNTSTTNSNGSQTKSGGSSGQAFITPSSYRAPNVNQSQSNGVNSYSQFR